ncbi:hypothetical protein SBA2_670026 [Acidobacteriia bacterium SbA2]|nr:hypothetical protein SBA2_670026 [Acidobacteriia bacterium SbA2]
MRSREIGVPNGHGLQKRLIARSQFLESEIWNLKLEFRPAPSNTRRGTPLFICLPAHLPICPPSR